MPWIKLKNFPRSPVASSSRHAQNDAPSRPSNDSKPSDDLDIQDASTPAVGSAELSSQMGRRTRTESSSEKPYHVFTPRMKSFVVLIVSAVAALSGLSSNIYFPAQQDISIVRLAHPCPRQDLLLPFFADCFAQKGLDISPEVVNLSITTYMIAQGLGPSFWAPLADWQGRRTTLVYTLLLYVASNVALALTTNSAMLLAFRALQAIGSSSTIALGAGVIADISPPNERGGYIGWFSGGECRNVLSPAGRSSADGRAVRQLSLALGPVIGGLLAGFLGWRSIFWFLTVFSGLCVAGVLLVLPETLRRIVGNGEMPLESWTRRPLLWAFMQGRVRGSHGRCRDGQDLHQITSDEIKPPKPFSASIFLQPFKLLGEWDTLCALLFGSSVYTAWSMMVASTTYLLKDVYQFNTVQ